MITSLIRAFARSSTPFTAEEIADVLTLVAAAAGPATITGADIATGEPGAPRPSRQSVARSGEPTGREDGISTIPAGEAYGYPAESGVPLRLTASVGSDSTKSASAVALPSAASLPHTLEIARSVRPFKRVRMRTGKQVFDLDATVEATAQAGRLYIASRSQQVQALDVAVVADISPSMAIWQGAVSDFARLLAQAGAFRTVTHWNLAMSGAGPAGRHVLLRDPGGTEHATERLIDPSGNRLVLVISDAVCDEWYDRYIWDVLNRWARVMPVTLMQVLPARYWRDTALGEPLTTCRAIRPASPNPLLKTRADAYALADESEDVNGVPLPVVALSPGRLTTWAAAMVTGSATMDSIIITPPNIAPPASANAHLTAGDRVRAFLGRASQGAQRLAGVLASAPVLSLPLIHILRAQLAPGTGITELAEVFAGGLLEKSPRYVEGSQPLYQFRAGIRERLIRGVTVLEQWELHDVVSEYLAAQTGIGKGSLVALVADPVGTLRLDPGLDAFAVLLDEVARSLGITAESAHPAPQAAELLAVLHPAGPLTGNRTVTARGGMRIILTGPPGAGKGRQAHFIASHLAVPRISTGDIFRYNVRRNTDLGAWAKVFMERGDLVPDEVAVAVIRDRLAEDDAQEGFVLDGFPRNVPQAETLRKMLAEWDTRLSVVLDFIVDQDEAVRRLSGRRTCSRCERVWHIVYDPPARDEICDDCGGDLFRRDDDSEERIRHRFQVYYEQTAPLIEFYAADGFMLGVDATGPVEEITSRVLAALRPFVR